MKALEGNDEDGIFQAFDMGKFFKICKRVILTGGTPVQGGRCLAYRVRTGDKIIYSRVRSRMPVGIQADISSVVRDDMSVRHARGKTHPSFLPTCRSYK